MMPIFRHPYIPSLPSLFSSGHFHAWHLASAYSTASLQAFPDRSASERYHYWPTEAIGTLELARNRPCSLPWTTIGLDKGRP